MALRVRTVIRTLKGDLLLHGEDYVARKSCGKVVDGFEPWFLPRTKSSNDVAGEDTSDDRYISVSW